MTQDATESPTTARGHARANRHVGLVWWATWVGLASAGVALASGLVMALEKKVVPCPDGKEFPRGTTDFACYAHPQASVGIAIAALSVGLAMVVVLTNIVARAGLAERGFGRRERGA